MGFDIQKGELVIDFKGVRTFMLDVKSIENMSPNEQRQYLFRLTEFLLIASRLNEYEVKELLRKLGLNSDARHPKLTVSALLEDTALEVFKEFAFARSA